MKTERFVFALLLSIALIPALFIVACGGGSSGDSAAGDEGFPIDQVEVAWFPCSFIVGEDDGGAECSSTEMPLFWDDPDGRTFTVYAKRRLSKTASQSQLWLLRGGPGDSGVIGLPGMMDYLQERFPELDVYTLDARGTGFSQYIECPEQEDPAGDEGRDISPEEVEDCVAYLDQKYGDTLRVYGTTAAAIDLAAFIHATREDGKTVLIWGGSGGTFWAQRYLRLFPDQADGIILEGIAPPDISLGFQDEYDEKIGRRILEMCREDSFCASKLPNPEEILVALYDKLDSGHCPALELTPTMLKGHISRLLINSPRHAVIPALIYRLDRCEPGDVEAVTHLYGILYGTEGHEYEHSLVLFYNEIMSEVWEHRRFANNDAFLRYLDELYEDAIIASGKGYIRNDVFLKWPRYEDPYDDQWAYTDVPMLMLQGVLDPATPYDFALALEKHFDGPHQHFVAFPYAPHNVLTGTPSSEDPGGMTCGYRLFVDFMKDPRAPLDLSCVDATFPPDFSGNYFGPFFFNTPDYWENPGKGGRAEIMPFSSPSTQLDLGVR